MCLAWFTQTSGQRTKTALTELMFAHCRLLLLLLMMMIMMMMMGELCDQRD